jgi:hypothetical protein
MMAKGKASYLVNTPVPHLLIIKNPINAPVTDAAAERDEAS